MKLTYANCFVPSGAHGDVLLTDEVLVAQAAPLEVVVQLTDTLVDADVAQQVNISASRLAAEWFLVGGEDPSTVDGISAADLASSEVAIALLMPAARAALGVTAAVGNEAPDLFTTIVPHVGGQRYQALETLQCDAAEAAVQARFDGSVPTRRRMSVSADNAALCEKYAWTRDPEWLRQQPPAAYMRYAVACRVINVLATIRGRRRASTLLVYEYNPTHAFAEQYSRRPGTRLRLARVRTPRADLMQIVRGADRMILPPRVARVEDRNALAQLERFSDDNRDILAERFEVAGVGLWPLLRRRLLATVARYRSYASVAAPIWRAHLKRQRIEAVVVPFDGLPETRLLVRVAQAAGIPTFLLNDGFKADDFSMDGMTADHVLAWSQAIADHYYSRRPGPRASVTGNPKADSQRAIRSRPLSPMRLRRVLVGSFTFSPVDLNCRRSDAEFFLGSVLEGISASNAARDAEVRVKLHPADRIDHYRHILEDFPDLAISIVSAGDVVDQFNASDLYVTTYSTSLLEAIARELPVVYYRVNPQRLHPPFSDDRFLAARTAETPAALAALLDDPVVLTLPGPEVRETWIERYLGPTDGRSTDRIERVVLSHLPANKHLRYATLPQP